MNIHQIIAMLMILSGLLAVAPCSADVPQDWAYGGNGWQWDNPDTGSYLWVGLRFQSRYSTLEDDPLISDDLRLKGHEGFSLNRARYKIGGGIGRKFTYYHEYDLRNGNLLDLRATWKPASWLNLRVGQWKAEFNRERIDSSGKQQFVERSIVTYWFTVDRQNGVMASGRLAAGQPADASWWLGVLNGNGLNSSGDGGKPMLLARYQWNFSGEILPFSQSALKRYADARGSLAFAVVTNDSPYTRFSSAGGGQLPGYGEGLENQYRNEQFLQEFSWQKGPWSIQQEFHYKKLSDRVNGGSNKLRGGYLNAGWFPSSHFEQWPEPLELAARVAIVKPYPNADSDESKEFTVAMNWFFKGHRNKLTTDVSRIKIDDPLGEEKGWRFRIQWDVSL